jgi:hypothetical protein
MLLWENFTPGKYDSLRHQGGRFDFLLSPVVYRGGFFWESGLNESINQARGKRYGYLLCRAVHHFLPPVFFSGVGDFHAIIMLDDSYEVFDDRKEDRRR